MTIEAVDGGSAPEVTITGGSTSRVIGATADLQLAPGTYDVTASPVFGVDPIVDTEYLPTVTGSPASVATGQTTNVDVSYTLLPGTGMLFYPVNSSGTLLGYTSAELQSADSPLVPALTLTTSGGAGEAVALDRAGGVWFAQKDSTVWGWTLFADGGASDPVVVTPLTGDGGTFSIYSITFGPNGNLWVVDYDNSQLGEVGASQLAVSGSVSANVLYGAVDDGGYASIAQPYGVAFDAQGNAWVVNGNAQTVAELPLLADGGHDANAAALFYGPPANLGNAFLNGVSFDPQGHLWVADETDGVVYHLDVSGGGMDQPFDLVELAELHSSTMSLADGGSFETLLGSDYVTFDQSGAMWSSSQYSGTLARFPNPELYTGVANPTPDLIDFTGSAGDVNKFAFDPPLPGMGMYPVSQ